MLKSRFRKKLYNHLHFLEFDLITGNKVHKAKYKCLRLQTEAQALAFNSEIKLSLKLYDQILEIAKVHSINDIMISALESKRKIYLDLSNEKEFRNCNNTLMACYEIQRLEQQALMIYQQAMITLKGSVSKKVKVIGAVSKVVDELKQLYKQ